jgi:MerR family transcriptional regulator, redox-sensitive transcriptional activator SoxR
VVPPRYTWWTRVPQLKLRYNWAIDDFLAIGTVAARAGVRVSALRFYEDRGLITSQRSEGGQRRYRRSVLRRVAFIQVAQRVGLTLEEIGAALASLPDDDALSAEDWRRLSKEWRPMLDERIRLLEALRDELDSCIGCGCLSLERCRLRNPGDWAARLGAGPRYLLGDDAHDAPSQLPETRRTIAP